MARPNSVRRLYWKIHGDIDSIDLEEAAAILGKSPKTLQRWRARGYGPAFVLESGRYVTYSRTTVKAWKAEHDFQRTPSERIHRISVQVTSGHKPLCR